jgi:hypothetical protein
MSIRFTIAPGGDFYGLSERLKKRLSLDPAVELLAQGPDALAYFAGVKAVRDVSMGGRGLASLRILPGAFVIPVDFDGYEASARHLAMYVRWILAEAGAACRLFDDETGSELTWRIQACPDTLFDAEPEYEEEPDE